MPNGLADDRNGWSSRDRYNKWLVSLLTPAVTTLATVLIVVLGWVFTDIVIGGIAEAKKEAKEAKAQADLSSQEQGGMKESIKRVDEKVTDFIVEQRKTNTEIKGGIDWLIRNQQQQGPRPR